MKRRCKTRRAPILCKTLCYPCIHTLTYVSPVIDIDKKSKQKTVSLFSRAKNPLFREIEIFNRKTENGAYVIVTS